MSMLDELNVMVTTLTKQIKDLEQQAKSSESHAKDSKARAEVAELEAMQKITAVGERVKARIGVIEQELAPYEDRRKQLDEIYRKIQVATQQMQSETMRLKQERHQELSQLTAQIAGETKRLEQIRQSITACKDAVAGM